MQEDIQPTKKYRFTIRVGIVLVFVSIFLAMSFLIMSLVAWRSYANAVVLTNQVTSAIATSIFRELNAQLNPTLATSKLSAELIDSGTLDPKNTPQMLSYTQKILTVLNSAQNAYWGDEEGNFIISRREENGALSSEVIHRNAENKRYRIDRDLQGAVLKQTMIEKMDYDPRLRPWYITAKEKKVPTWSPPYVFYSGKSGTLGTTSATPVFAQDKLRGVFGIDIKLESIAAFLAKTQISENGIAFIVNQEGNLLALNHPVKPLTNVHEINRPAVSEAFDTYQKQSQDNFSYNANGYQYHAVVFPVAGFEQYKLRLFIIVPDRDITGPILRANYLTFMVCLFLMLCGIILISVLSKRISRPIRSLARDLERVRLFDIRPKGLVDTRVKEIYLMSDAIARMKVGLLSFKKYVPRELVQLLIEKGEAAKLGGKEIEITLMFTDIENFTTIAEKTSAEDIMVHMCEYFDLLGEAIQENHGIVDKFIGDAVMAFWGAPEADDDQSYHACLAALIMQEKITAANLSWNVRGMQELPTRIGIHRGMATVGNLGSHERLNYTAIGDTVNISSRLEMLNKVYGTRIIVSHDIYEKCHDKFIFRLLDKVVVKGRNQFNYIYELLALRTPENELKYARLLLDFEKALQAYQTKNFTEAMILFQDILSREPNDGPSIVYMGRSEVFSKVGVPDNWNGVWIYTHKDTQR